MSAVTCQLFGSKFLSGLKPYLALNFKFYLVLNLIWLQILFILFIFKFYLVLNSITPFLRLGVGLSAVIFPIFCVWVLFI